MIVWEQMQPGFRRLIWCLLPLALFGTFFNWHVLDPTRIHWALTDDWGQHVLGWQAYRNSPLSWPFNHETLLAAPNGLSLIYTDSNPPLAFLFRLLAPVLPAEFQYMGLWFLLCLMLQVLFAWLLVRRHAPNPWLALGGALLLCLLPTLYNRMNHDTLMAHWLILAGLWIYLEDWTMRTRWLAWSILLGFTAMLHPYLLVMVAAIWSGDVWRHVMPSWRTRDWASLQPVLPLIAAPLVVAVLGLAVVGAFGDQSPGADGFGIYSMGLDGPFNPGQPNFSKLIKAHAVDPGQMAEGFQYMGAGLLFLLAAALTLHLLDRPAQSKIDKLRALILPFAVLLCLAVSNRIQLYDHTLFRFSIPDPLKAPFDVVRASGRLFWPIAYLLVWMALITVFASRRRHAVWLIPAALVLQIVDLQGFAQAERTRTAEAATRNNFVLTPSPQWTALIGAARQVDVYPPNPHANDRLFYEIAWRSVSAHVPVNTMYPARYSVKQSALEEAGRQAFMAGAIDPTHLYVLINPCNIPFAAGRVRVLDGVWIIPPASAQNLVTATPTPMTYGLNETFTFGWHDKGACLAGQGFAMPQQWQTWDQAPEARLGVDLAQGLPDGTHLHLTFHGEKHPHRVNVRVNGLPVGSFIAEHAQKSFDAGLPPALSGQKHLDITFTTNDLRQKSRKDPPLVFALESLRLASLHP